MISVQPGRGKVTRYAALLRGVSPMNAKMSELKRAFEDAGFEDVRTVRSSGNVVFSAPAQPVSALQRSAEAAMRRRLGREFLTIVRSIAALQRVLAADPFEPFELPPDAKRIITFLRARPGRELALPMEFHGARILAMKGTEVFSVYVPDPSGPNFMTLIEKTLGKEVTTRTWETVEMVAR